METEYEGKSPEELVEILTQRDEDLKKAEEDKNATVGELKDLRTKKQEVEEELEKAKQAKTEENPSGETDTTAVVEKYLSEKAEKEAKENRGKAIEEFRASQHEFSEAADPGGIKFAAFEKELEKFNLQGLSSVEDFKSRFKEVHEFMNRGQQPENNDNPAPYRGSSRESAATEPENNKEHELDAREQKLLQQTGWTKERYLALKEKQPQFVESQLALVQ